MTNLEYLRDHADVVELFRLTHEIETTDNDEELDYAMHMVDREYIFNGTAHEIAKNFVFSNTNGNINMYYSSIEGIGFAADDYYDAKKYQNAEEEIVSKVEEYLLKEKNNINA